MSSRHSSHHSSHSSHHFSIYFITFPTWSFWSIMFNLCFSLSIQFSLSIAQVALEFILLLKDTLYAGVVPDRNKRATQNTLIQPWQKNLSIKQLSETPVCGAQRNACILNFELGFSSVQLRTEPANYRVFLSLLGRAVMVLDIAGNLRDLSSHSFTSGHSCWFWSQSFGPLGLNPCILSSICMLYDVVCNHPQRICRVWARCSTTSIASKPYFLTTNGMLQRFAQLGKGWQQLMLQKTGKWKIRMQTTVRYLLHVM